MRRALCRGLTAQPRRSLRLIAPVIRDHGIEYEQGKFQEKLNSGALRLAQTEVSPHWCCG